MRSPWGLRLGLAVAAAVNDAAHLGAEALLDLIACGAPPLIFHRVVQQRGDALVFVAAVLHHESAHPHEVTHVGDVSPFAGLCCVKSIGEGEGLLETSGE